MKSAVPSADPTPEEPTVARIHELARHGLSNVGPHGEVGSMGVPRKDLPHWDDIQILPAQMARKPLLDETDVATSVTIGPRALKPLKLDIPLFVSDMSFGALSEEAKIALARGAELAGTGICSGEGGMLAEEQAENSRYFYELASAQFGWNLDFVEKVQAFHFKGVQGAKTGTGGHLPREKVKGQIGKLTGQPIALHCSQNTFRSARSKTVSTNLVADRNLLSSIANLFLQTNFGIIARFTVQGKVEHIFAQFFTPIQIDLGGYQFIAHALRFGHNFSRWRNYATATDQIAVFFTSGLSRSDDPTAVGIGARLHAQMVVEVL
jgi:hypothetical protein